MSELKTDYKDDILDETVNTNRTFNVRDNQGNLLYQDVQLEETTVFEQEGDTYGAAQVNEQNQEINEINTHLSSRNKLIDSVTFSNGNTYTATEPVNIIGWYRADTAHGGGVFTVDSDIKGGNFVVSSTATMGYYCTVTIPVEVGETLTFHLTSTQGSFIAKICKA